MVPPGVTTLLLVVMLFGALNLFAIGVIGEYMAKVFEEVKRRPLYLVDERLNLGTPAAAADPTPPAPAMQQSARDRR